MQTLLCLESLPHPGLDVIFRRVRERLAATGVPVAYHECTHAERATPGAIAPFSTALRNALMLRAFSDAPHVFVGQACTDSCHLPAASGLHAEAREHLLCAVGAHQRSIIAVHLRCDVHDCFERACSTSPSCLMTLDDLDACGEAVRRALVRADAVREIECPAFFEDDEAFVKQTVDDICDFFETYIKKPCQ